jgi:ribonucleoside-diphosphate reductase alpha chain
LDPGTAVIAKSLMDYIFRWLELAFLKQEDGKTEVRPSPNAGPADPEIRQLDDAFRHFQEDAPACEVCGAITVRNGSCYRCYHCGHSMGCS